MTAINAKADAVYFGAGNLNMRARSSANFNIDDIQKIASLCSENNVKSYLTLNTVVYDDESEKIKEIIYSAKKAGVTALIASDMSVINYCREIGIQVHASTQLNVSNIDAVKFFAGFCDVIVLARELNINQVKKISDSIIEQNIKGPSGNLVRLEMFVHGALCMSISGKCYLSLHEHNYSANRGACLQACRRKYEVRDKETGIELEIDNEYIMSPKDLCTITFLDKILEAGVTVLKIEGRGRSPEYVKVTTESYNEALELICSGNYSPEESTRLEEKLKTVYNRGFWDGYYLGRRLGEWTDRHGSSATKTKEYVGKIIHFYPNNMVAVTLVESSGIRQGDEILITGTSTGAYTSQIDEIRIDDKKVDYAQKGDIISFKTETKVRPNDKLYKVVFAER
jgi:putative protease